LFVDVFCSQLLGYGATPLSLDKLLEHPEQAVTDEYIPHSDERMWFRRVERAEATSLLEGREDGTFLIRPKEHGIHCLSIVYVPLSSSDAQCDQNWLRFFQPARQTCSIFFEVYFV